MQGRVVVAIAPARRVIDEGPVVADLVGAALVLQRGVGAAVLVEAVAGAAGGADPGVVGLPGRIGGLEQQVRSPIESPEEMANTVPTVEQRLNSNRSYQQEFAKAWGSGPITFEMVEKSIASFERTLLSGNSPFDRWKYGHDQKAVSSSVKRGYNVFSSPKKGNCAVCHVIGQKCALFTDNKFHDIGVGVQSGQISDPGLSRVTHNEADRGKFKTPSLRNIGLTAPYMHDGSLKDLKQVLDFYIGAGNSHANLDKEIHTLDFLTGQERRDLLAFLNSLTGEMPKVSGILQ